MKKVIIITRRVSKPIAIESNSREIPYIYYNAHYYSRLFAKCVMDLSPNALAYMGINKFYSLSGVEADPRLVPGINGNFKLKKVHEVEIPEAADDSLSGFFTDLAGKNPVDKCPYESMMIDSDTELIQVFMDEVKYGIIGDENLALSAVLRKDLILSVCRDCGVERNGENILYIHDKEWGMDCRMVGGKEYMQDHEDLPSDVVVIADYFKYVGVFMHLGGNVLFEAIRSQRFGEIVMNTDDDF